MDAGPTIYIFGYMVSLDHEIELIAYWDRNPCDCDAHAA